jgi:hypothetical protein
MRMTSTVFIILGILLIIVAVKDNLKVVLGEIQAIGKGTALQPGQPGGPPGDCIDTHTGKKVPCISQNSLTQIQQNLVTY